MLAKRQFISDMKPEVEAYLYNTSAAVDGFSGVCADMIMDLYADAADKSISEMSLMACKKFPEAFCQLVLSRSCEAILLDRKNDSVIFSSGSLSKDGQAILAIYEGILNLIASDPKKPAGQHNANRLEFVKNQLRNRMK